ncbi:MAG: DNA-processing protein DprA [Sphingomonadales bacterium]
MSLPADAVARVQLIRTETIGPVTYRQLLARFGSASAAVAALPDIAGRSGRAISLCPADQAEAEIAANQALGGQLLFLGHGAYPPLLAGVEQAPPLLHALGDVRLLERPAVAIVGARNASAAGARLARQLAIEMGQADLVVVSGLARGIDAAAHEGGLPTGTVAAVAGGIDVAYPPENAALLAKIVAQGLVLSMQPPGTQPLARHFPRRNRIIAGLSAGTLVVEGAPKSGSLITARLAAEMNREVMAVPGSPLDPRAQGCNQLIREGATLIQSGADVLEALGGFAPGAGAGSRFMPVTQELPLVAPSSESARAAVLALLSPTPVAVDELTRQAGLPAAAVASVLLDLELAGQLVRHAGGRVALG